MPKMGIDVSQHNGKIDWDAMKRSGVSFAIIRSSWGHFVEDSQFRRNVRECERIKLPYGLYHYSYVSNTKEMKEECDGFLRLCKSCRPSYPCYLDMEDADGWKKAHHVSDAQNIETCYYTCRELEKAKFYAGIYANLYWLTHQLNSRRLDRFDKWVAQWASKNTYDRPYGMWQFTSDGRINGYGGRLDLDYAYKDYPRIIREKGLNGFDAKPEPAKPGKQEKYKVGTPVTYTGLWTQANGGNWYPRKQLAIKQGIITKIISGAQHPYLINDGVGWTNDKAIDDEPILPTL